MKIKSKTELIFNQLSNDYIWLEDVCSTLNIEIEKIKDYLLKYKIKIFEQKIYVSPIHYEFIKFLHNKNKFINFSIDKKLNTECYFASKEYIFYTDSHKLLNLLDLAKRNTLNTNTKQLSSGEIFLENPNQNNSNNPDLYNQYNELVKTKTELEKKISNLKKNNANLTKEIHKMRDLENKNSFSQKREDTLKTIIKFCFKIAEGDKRKKYIKNDLLTEINRIHNKTSTSVLGAYFEIFWQTLPEKYKQGPGKPPKKNTSNPTE